MSQTSNNITHEKILMFGTNTSDAAASISESIQGLYQAVYLKLTGWWGLTLLISIPPNFPFDLSTASLVCVL